MKASVNSYYAELVVGRTVISLWWRSWGLSFHAQPCCRFYLELGPLEIMR